MSNTYNFDFSDGEAPFTTWMSSQIIPASEGGGTRLLLPGDIDPNHIDGIGPLYLLAHLSLPTVGSPGIMDLSGATITLDIRGEDFNPNGAKLVVWVCTYLTPDVLLNNFPYGEEATNYAYTAMDLVPQLVANDSADPGAYEPITFTLNPDPSNWTYAGNNISEQGDWAQRYEPLDLNYTLTHADATLHFVLIGTKPDVKPSGYIDIKDISVTTNTPAISTPAQANAQIFKGVEDTPLTATLMQGMTGLTSFTLVPNSALHGSVTINSATGQFTFTPDPNYFGPTDVASAASFQYTFFDGTTTSAVQTATVYIGPVNDPPVVSTADEDLQIQSNTPFTFTLLKGTDPDERAQFTFQLVPGSVVGGTVTIDAFTGIYTFTPTAGFTGAASFSYLLNDGFDYSTTSKTVNLTVTNQAPALPTFTDIDNKFLSGDTAGGYHDEILLAQAGNPVGEYQYAMLLKYGNFVNKDTALAAVYFNKALGIADDDAVQLADLYIQGDGVVRDYVQARTLLATVPNSADAQYRLGLLDDLGFGLPGGTPDHVSATAHYLTSSKMGDPSAMFSLGRQYLEGDSGLGLDYQDAYFWLGTTIKFGSTLQPSDILDIAQYDQGLAAANLSPSQITALNAAISQWAPGSGTLVFVGDNNSNLLIGTPTANYLIGQGGNDTLDDGRGPSSLQGGTGDDTYIVHVKGDTITEFAGEGNDTVRTDLSSFILPANVENLIYTGAGNFTGIGNDTGAIIIGQSGNDLLEGGHGSDYLIGQAGNDTLDGGTGAPNTLQGGIGDDTYYVHVRGDTVTEFPNEGNDTVRTDLPSYILPANVENLVYIGSSSFIGIGNNLGDDIIGGPGGDTLIGGTGSDYLIGGTGNDVMDGGTGAPDTLQGGAGDDTYYVHVAGESIVEFAGEGNDTVRTDLASYTLPANVENLLYIGTGSFIGIGNDSGDTIIGGSHGDTLIGGHGSDYLVGGAGNDVLDGGTGAPNVLQGGAGDDTYYVHVAGDSIIEFPGEGNDTVRTDLASYTLPANVETLIYIGTGSFSGTGNDTGDTIIGGPGSNTLTGGAGSDYLVGGAGSDTLDGGAGAPNVLQGGGGDDTYIIHNAGDTIIEAAGQGTDQVITSLTSYTLPANVENLSFTGSAGVVGIGNALNNVITGGPGNDTLTGGGGNDTFNYRAASNGADTITDFNADNSNTAEHDHIDLTGRGLTFSALTVTTVSDGALVAIPGGDLIHLPHVSASALDAGDFFF